MRKAVELPTWKPHSSDPMFTIFIFLREILVLLVTEKDFKNDPITSKGLQQRIEN